MKNVKKRIADIDQSAVDRWNDEGGASASGSQATSGRAKGQGSYLAIIRPYSDSIAVILRKVRSKLSARWNDGLDEKVDGPE